MKARSAEQLTSCIHEVLEVAVYIGGLDIVARVCDMGTSNVKALKLINCCKITYCKKFSQDLFINACK